MTLAHLTHAVAETALISAPTMLDGALHRLTPELCDARLDTWSKTLLARAQIELEVIGLEHARRDEAYVVMSNHQSLYDIPVMFQALRRRVRMVAKKELFKVPIWAQAMRLAGFVELDRSNRERAIASLEHAQEALRVGTNIWIAPEGTRSRSGELLPFKKGGFYLAREARARILPVTVLGTRNVLSARGFRVHPGALVRVIVSAPIDPSAYPDAADGSISDALVADVRSAISAHLQKP